MAMSRKRTRSLSKIYTPKVIKATKKMKLIYPSMVKYFCGLSLPTPWIMTPNNLPPSNAGIGRTLKIASASEIIPANPKNNVRPPELSNDSPTLITPAGPVSWLNDVLILVLSNDKRSLPSVPSVLKVSLVSAAISCNPAPIALSKGNLIGLRLIAPAEKVSHNTQLSVGQCA